MHDPAAGTAPLLLGLALGMRHALDGDHVVAMSTIVARERSVMRAALQGAAWGIGHSLALLTVGLLVLFFNVPWSASWSMALERLVGIMIIVLGVLSLVVARSVALAEDASVAARVPTMGRRRPFGVGLVHGLAGSGALAIAVLATIPSRAAGVVYIALFGAGAVGGMMLITSLIALPLRFGFRSNHLAGGYLSAAAGVGSVAFGIYYLTQCA